MRKKSEICTVDAYGILGPHLWRVDPYSCWTNPCMALGTQNPSSCDRFLLMCNALVHKQYEDSSTDRCGRLLARITRCVFLHIIPV